VIAVVEPATEEEFAAYLVVEPATSYTAARKKR
jgi:hypothetical protein